MQATVVTFPGGMKPVNLPGLATLRQVLESAGASPSDGEQADIAVDGEIVTNLDAEVPEGSIVTKTKRVAGG